MKHAIAKTVGSLLLISGACFTLPAYAEMPGGMNAPAMNTGDRTGQQQWSEIMGDMSTRMSEISGIMGRDNVSPDTVKKLSGQMAQMSDMMKNMSGMMGNSSMMNIVRQQQMGQMRMQMDELRKGISATN